MELRRAGLASYRAFRSRDAIAFTRSNRQARLIPNGRHLMTKPPERTRRPTDPRERAEAAFKSATTKAADAAAAVTIPVGKELVSLRIDRDVLEYFQADGPGWQERINTALRKAAGK